MNCVILCCHFLNPFPHQQLCAAMIITPWHSFITVSRFNIKQTSNSVPTSYAAVKNIYIWKCILMHLFDSHQASMKKTKNHHYKFNLLLMFPRGQVQFSLYWLKFSYLSGLIFWKICLKSAGLHMSFLDLVGFVLCCLKALHH